MSQIHALPQQVSKDALGTTWGQVGQPLPMAEQMSLTFDRLKQLRGDQKALRELFAEMVRAFGGVDALTVALDRKPSYGKKIYDAAAGTGDHRIQSDWWPPLLRDPKCAQLWLEFWSKHLGYEPPVRARVVSQEDVDKASRKVIGRLDGLLKAMLREEVARELGVKSEDVKL